MTTLSRRTFVSSLAASGILLSTRASQADEPVPVERPRATDGDERFEPDWKDRLTITVGTKESDMVGRDDRVIQAALDYVARMGGGTVHILPGTFVFRNAVSLPSGVRLLGSGADSILTKIASESVELSEDSDWYDQEVTLQESKNFRVGDGVVFKAKNPHNGGETVIKRTLMAASGRRFKINDGLRENLWLTGKPTCLSLFPLLTSERTANVTIENITLDGNKDQNENFNGNYGGCIFLQDCNRFIIRRVEARNYNGDGISFQICHDVVVEDCHSHDNVDLGIHPGSGSQRPLLRNNRIERNSQGIFWCWGVKYGLAEDNRIDGNRLYGISIGHNDTDNVMRRNVVSNSGKIGVLFRDENRGADFWPNRNTLEENQILDSGDESGVAIDILGKTRDVRFVKNVIRETRGPSNRIGVRISEQAGQVDLLENRFEGFSQDVADLRKPS
jgi:Right handed beta helix region